MARVLILEGDAAEGPSRLRTYGDQLVVALGLSGHDARRQKLRELDIHRFIGCFDCWVLHPGRCRFEDDGPAVCQEYLLADVVVFASPVVAGFISPTTKRCIERLLPLMHCHFGMVDGETHHLPRYDGTYPRLVLLLKPDAVFADEDLSILGDIFQRTALNLFSSLALILTTDNPLDDSVDEITRL